MSRRAGLALAASLAASFGLVAGCASHSGIAPKLTTVSADALPGAATVAYADWPKDAWWEEFKDPVLSRLIEQALADNPGLHAAGARLARAEALVRQTGSALWPALDAAATTTRERFSEHGMVPPPYAGTTRSLNDAQLAGRWDVDFFGRNREQLRAALGEAKAAEAEQQAARVLLAGRVAKSYYQLARLLALRAVLEERSRQRGELARLVERRVAAGIDTQVELESARGVLPETARDVAALDEQIALVRHALAALSAQGPEAAKALAPVLPDVARLAIPARLPAELLGHRADVVAARWRVEAATHGLASTRALFYPNVNLRAFAGLTAIGFDRWLDAGSRQSGIGLAVSLPVFDAGRLRALHSASAAQVDGAVASYNASLLDALREVADQLASVHALETQLARQAEALASAERSHALALQRYRAGIADRLNVLQVETHLLAQRRLAVDLRARSIDARIALIGALGGGFAESAPARAAQP